MVAQLFVFFLLNNKVIQYLNFLYIYYMHINNSKNATTKMQFIIFTIYVHINPFILSLTKFIDYACFFFLLSIQVT